MNAGTSRHLTATLQETAENAERLEAALHLVMDHIVGPRPAEVPSDAPMGDGMIALANRLDQIATRCGAVVLEMASALGVQDVSVADRGGLSAAPSRPIYEGV